MRPLRHFVLFAALAGAASGCDSIRSLRAFFRGEPGAAKVSIEVTPTKDMSIALDGHVVATQSSFEDDAITPGAHTLSIAAQDHYTFTVPIEIHPGIPFRLVVALRRIPHTEVATRQRVTRPRELRTRAPAETRPVALPESLPPIQLTIAGDPSSVASLNGQPLSNKSFTIEHVTGDFGMGRAEVRFRVGAGGLLELQIPDDGTQWFRDGDPVEPGARITFYRGKTRLQQIQPNGETQTIYLAR